MTDSIINKAGDFYEKYGRAGLYAYLGGREALFKARGQLDDNDPRWKLGTPEYLNTWDFNYLGLQYVFDQAAGEMDKAYPLVVSYSGSDLNGTGAWDNGVIPPMSASSDKLLWTGQEMVGKTHGQANSDLII